MLSQELISLKESLHFLHMEELKNLANRLSLLDKGKKLELITRIVHFLQTGEKLLTPKFPAISCAKDKNIPLLTSGLMLKGAYKNDLKTRLFFKALIGDYFHFTAFGIDWLNERWMEGKPPTYQEFADMWKLEYQRRKEDPVAPKAEWAYINFLQDFYSKYPDFSHKNATKAWDQEREKHKNYVEEILKKKTI